MQIPHLVRAQSSVVCFGEPQVWQKGSGGRGEAVVHGVDGVGGIGRHGRYGGGVGGGGGGRLFAMSDRV
jgi:hypothetical protein